MLKLIIGDNVGICNECVDFCVQILKDTELKKDNINLDPIIIKEYLDCYVIGQNDAKIALSVAVANHYKRLQAQVKNVEVNKANLLMIGPTGCGKTMLAKTIARYLNVPFTIADATSLTEAGYVGDDVETILQKLLYASDHDIEKAQQGIVFIDEIDKISRKSESASITRDVSGEGVQQAMLKIIEGCSVRVNLQGNRKHPMGDAVEMDTSNILFILGGSFVGLEKIVQCMSINPRTILQYEVPIIKEGYEANMTLFDPDKKWIYDKNNNTSMSENTGLFGSELNGFVHGTIHKSNYHKNVLK